MSLLPNDTTMQFPHLFVIPASAGSGKTYTLSHRYVQFLLSRNISMAGLRNILAITFTKVAAKEMKERIIKVLKEAALRNPRTTSELLSITSLNEQELWELSGQMVDRILQNYSDFNVRTIDSFLTTVFKASAMELGVQPNVEIDFDHDAVIDQAFRQYSQNLREGTADARFVNDLIRLMESNDTTSGGYLWNPFTKIVREVRQLQSQFGKFSHDPIQFDGSAELELLKKRIVESAKKVKEMLGNSSLPVSVHFKNDVEKLSNGDVLTVASKGRKKSYFNKYTDSPDAKKEVGRIWKVIGPMEEDIDRYMFVYAQSYYAPFVRAVAMISETIKEVKLLEGKVVIDDINRSLGKYMSDAVVPEVYLKLGERIAHFMIDEFQDTSPIQWKNLYALIDEAVSKGGTLFAVGDTKQSIYSFRGGDWKIFRDLVSGAYFPSATVSVIPLEKNYRSSQALVDFVKEVFSANVNDAGLSGLAAQSGLYNFAQDVPDAEKNKGYVEVKRIDVGNEEDPEQLHKEYLISVIKDCLSRGYALNDIAILTPTNAEVVEISSWLNSAKIDFLSMSTLDIRKRKVIGELIALLRFLDSPIDDLSFTTFVTGELFRKNVPQIGQEEIHSFIVECRQKRKGSYYRAFRSQYHEVWEQFFERLFTLVGYMPLYDIVSESFKTFSVFQHSRSEESALVKFLECVKQFENTGNNSLKDFLSFSSEQGSDSWSVQVPGNVHAVRIMTVHKAKGLGFPVVIVSLQEKRSRANSMVTRETEAGVEVIRVSKGYGERSETLSKIYSDKEDEQTIDELNKIYVALTRARKEMYVVTLFKKSENLPACILPERTYGKKFAAALQETPEERLPQIESLYYNEQTTVPAARYQKIGIEETRRGDLIHEIFSNIEYLGENISETVKAAVASLKSTDAHESETSQKVVEQFLSLPEMAEYFTARPGRDVLCEQDIAASSGRLYRMDRVIVDQDRVTVVDFKTGHDEHQ
jgi:ATP-dependent helicase/nuclease subunit A